MAALDITDPEHPQVEVYFLRADGDNYRVPIEDMGKELAAGHKMRMLQDYTDQVDRAEEYYQSLEKQHRALIDDYNILVDRYNRLAALSNVAQQQQQRRDWLREWMIIQQLNNSQQQVYFPRRPTINCNSTTFGNRTSTECQ